MDKIISGGFDEFGFPFLDILVLNKELNLSSKAKAIIDTGAAHCLIQEELAKRLQLKELRIADYRHPLFGKMPLKEYIMDISFDGNELCNGTVMEGVRVGTLADSNYPASLIIGVEVLKYCRFEYDGHDQRFTFSINK